MCGHSHGCDKPATHRTRTGLPLCDEHAARVTARLDHPQPLPQLEMFDR